MSWVRAILTRLGIGSDSLDPAEPVRLDVEARTKQLTRLEQALDALIAAMTSHTDRMANPGWKERVAEYKRSSGTAYTLRRGGFTREQLLDLAFEVRPVADELPDDLGEIPGLQAELMEAAEALREVLPSELEP